MENYSKISHAEIVKIMAQYAETTFNLAVDYYDEIDDVVKLDMELTAACYNTTGMRVFVSRLFVDGIKSICTIMRDNPVGVIAHYQHQGKNPGGNSIVPREGSGEEE